MVYVLFFNYLLILHVIQEDVLIQHEQNEWNDNDLTVDNIKPKLNKDIIGRWISIAFNREFHGHTFLVFDIGVITDIKSNLVYVHYKTDEVIVAVPLKSNDFNSSITSPPSKQYMWRMLLQKEQLKETKTKRRKLEK